MTPEKFQEIRKTIPDNPGVYRFFDVEDNLLYVGKAKSLMKRVSSYFIDARPNSAKLEILKKKTETIIWTVVEDEKEALLLENNLIKEHQPKYNILLRDDKTYPYIVIKNEPFPRIFFTRRKIKDGSKYFGPFTSVSKARDVLFLLKTLYKIRTCSLNLSKVNLKKKKFRVCLEYHIKNCLGPCEEFQSQEDYNNQIKQCEQILQGKFRFILKALTQEMEQFSKKLEFEKAAEIKQRVESLKTFHGKSTVVSPSLGDLVVFSLKQEGEYFYSNFLKVADGILVQSRNLELRPKLNETEEDILLFAIESVLTEEEIETKEIILPFPIPNLSKEFSQTIPQKGEKRKLLILSGKNALQLRNNKLLTQGTTLRPGQLEVLEEIKKDLNLKELPFTIECFDNSNIQGTNPVASMVVFKNGKPSNKDYRHYNIQSVEGPNDFASMEEVVFRRYKRILEENETLPQLVVIDGGKGQLSSAVHSLKKLGIEDKIQLISIAKRLEEIYYPNDPVPVHLSKRSQTLRVLQHIRNEAHRFAIEFHRKKREQNAIITPLDDLKGIGPRTKEKLLATYKTIKKMRQASLEELASLTDLAKAKILFSFLHSDQNQ